MEKQRFTQHHLGVFRGDQKLYTVYSHSRAIGHTTTLMTADYHPQDDENFTPVENWQNTFSPRLIQELNLS